MFELTENRFLNDGVCKYRDEYGNGIFMKRKGDSFTGKLRFYNEDVRMDPLTFHPGDAAEQKGVVVNVDYKGNVNRNSADIVNGISGFTNIVQRWVNMFSDIAMFQTDNTILAQAYPDISSKDIWNNKLSRISQYEELKPMLESIFG